MSAEPGERKHYSLREHLAFAGLLITPVILGVWIAFLVWWAGWMLGFWGGG